MSDIASIAAGAGATLTTAQDDDEHDVWGPACHYGAGDQFFEIYLSVNNEPAALDHFDSCKANTQAVPGLGDEAYFDRIRGCPINVGFYFDAQPLMVKSGDTVVAVARRDSGPLDNSSSLDTLIAVARVALQRLGLNPGATLAPLNSNVLDHPCSLLSDTEVRQAITGAAIASHSEWAADQSGLNALCIYATDNYSINPLQMMLGHGQEAINGFTQDRTYGNATPVTGLGDEAFEKASVQETDQPLVSLWVRSGETVVQLDMGPVAQSADYLSYVAPGNPDMQLGMLRQLVSLLLPRLSGS